MDFTTDRAQGNYEKRSSKFAVENAKCWVIFESSYHCNALQLLAARLPELASKWKI